MIIELHEICVGDLAQGYKDRQELGVVAYDGKLDVRPPYQREFIYGEKQRAAVIDTATRDFPLNVMYWAVRDDGGFEIIDGQQRTISLCQFVEGDFSYNGRYFYNLQDNEQKQILDYKLMIYRCSGTDSEKLEWFEIINIAGEKLTPQELRNAVYSGPWVTDAKKYFSKTGCPAIAIGGDYLSGKPIRQEFLETAIEWISGGGVDAVNDYMATHQHEPKASELWLHFKRVTDWVTATFPKYRSEMKGLEWGKLYAAHHQKELDSTELEKQVATLMADDDVTSNKGVYSFVLTGEEKHLNLRAFDNRMRRTSYEKQKGICPGCAEHFEIEQMQADHKTPWSKGGKTLADNCVMLCAPCNREKWDV